MSSLLALLPLLVMLLLTVPTAGGALGSLLGGEGAGRLPRLRDRAQVLESAGLGVFGLAVGLTAPASVVQSLLWWLAATSTALVVVVGVLGWRRLPGTAPDARGRAHPRGRTVSVVFSLTLGAVGVVALSGVLAG